MTTTLRRAEVLVVGAGPAGLVAAGQSQKVAALYKRRAKEQAFGQRMNKAFQLRPELHVLCASDTIVCRCEDVPFARLQGHASWTEAKLQTRCGMGPCQGRICGPAVQALFDWRPTSVRSPIFPVPVSAFGNSDNDSVEESTTYQETKFRRQNELVRSNARHHHPLR